MYNSIPRRLWRHSEPILLLEEHGTERSVDVLHFLHRASSHNLDTLNYAAHSVHHHLVHAIYIKSTLLIVSIPPPYLVLTPYT